MTSLIFPHNRDTYIFIIFNSDKQSWLTFYLKFLDNFVNRKGPVHFPLPKFVTHNHNTHWFKYTERLYWSITNRALFADPSILNCSFLRGNVKKSATLKYSFKTTHIFGGTNGVQGFVTLYPAVVHPHTSRRYIHVILLLCALKMILDTQFITLL